MFLVVGLGNPGNKYNLTRHNIGFMAVDYLADKAVAIFNDSKWDAQIVKSMLWGKQYLLVKPSSYMNLSGKPVAAIASFYKINTGNIVVIHDDLDLEVGRVKIVRGRGAGGHNGVKSVIEHLGTKDFIRIRVGIGRPPERMSSAAFVLSKFSERESEEVGKAFKHMGQGIRIIGEDDVGAAMNFVNRQVK